MSYYDEVPKSKLGYAYYVTAWTLAIIGAFYGFFLFCTLETEVAGSINRIDLARETARQHPVPILINVLLLLPLIHFYIVHSTKLALSLKLERDEKPGIVKVVVVSTAAFVVFMLLMTYPVIIPLVQSLG